MSTRSAPGLRRSIRYAAAAAVVAAAAAGFAVPPLGAADGGAEIFPYEVHEKVLDNGLKVVVVPFDSPGVVAYFTVVRTGSRDEVEAGHSGFAHFFEHMMFRGTDKYSQDEYNDELKKMGADSNAFTTDDYTNYYIIGPASQLETMVDIESDRFKNLEYDEPGFRTEALAVLGEYNKNASNPFFPMYERLRQLAFEKHTYQHTTMGFLEDIQAMPGYYEYSLGFFDRFYRPENAVVLVVGDARPAKVFELAERYYGDWEPGYQAPTIAAEPPQQAKKTAQIDWPSPTRPHLMIGYRTPAFDPASPETAALDVIAQLLFAESAPLYQELVVDKQWVDFVGGDAAFRRDPYLFMMQARVRSEERLPDVLATIERHIARLRDEPVSAERLDRIKAHMRYGFALGLDTAGSVGFAVAEFLNLTGDPDAINRLYRQYAAVTPAEVQRVAREVFKESSQTVVTLAHAGDSEAAPAAAAEGASR